MIESFLGGDGARIVEAAGPAAGFTHVSAEMNALFGSNAGSVIRLFNETSWSRTASNGGAHGCPLLDRSQARERLARPLADGLFLMGEATPPNDLTTAHGPPPAAKGLPTCASARVLDADS